MDYSISSPSHGGCLKKAHPPHNLLGVHCAESLPRLFRCSLWGVGAANLDGPLCFLLGLHPFYCSCSFRPSNVRPETVAKKMEVGSHMEVLFLDQISSGSSDQASRVFCLPITVPGPVVSSWACLSLATSGWLIIYNNIFKQSCLWVCSCRAWKQCGLVIKDARPRVGPFFLGGRRGVCYGIR